MDGRTTLGLGAVDQTIAVSDGVPAPGAGNLETKASVDIYKFTAAAGQSVYLDWTSCPGGNIYADWTLYNDATGSSVSTGGCPDKQINDLPAGTYRLEVKVKAEKTGPYAFKLFDSAP